MNRETAPKTQILLVEDDPILGRGLSVSLEAEGYLVSWAQDLASAQQAQASRSPDLVLLDQGLPDGNGLTFLQGLRAAGSRLPVIILTARTDEDSVVAGLQAGANDYVRKPFSNRELMARITTALRLPSLQDHKLKFGDLVLSLEQRRTYFGEVEIELNRREFDILAHLVRHGDAVVTRDSLLSSLDKEGEIFDRTIDSHISHLRSRLRKAGVERTKISSVYGVGYRLEFE